LTWTSSSSFTPAIAVDSNDVIHLIWKDSMAGNNELYYKKSADGGASWSAAQKLTWTSGESHDPNIAIDSNNALYLFWYDYTPNAEIFFKTSADGGASWGPAQRLTWTSGYSSSPAIAIDSNRTIHVVWEDSTPGNYEVYYKSSG
jgi:hypothetical protein